MITGMAGFVIFLICIITMFCIVIIYLSIVGISTKSTQTINWNVTAECLNHTYGYNFTAHIAKQAYQNTASITTINSEIAGCLNYTK